MSLNKFHFDQRLLVAISKLLAEFWLDIWTLLLVHNGGVHGNLLAFCHGPLSSRAFYRAEVRTGFKQYLFRNHVWCVFCWDTQLCPTLRCLVDGLRLCWRILRFFTILSTLCNTPGKPVIQQIQVIADQYTDDSWVVPDPSSRPSLLRVTGWVFFKTLATLLHHSLTCAFQTNPS